MTMTSMEARVRQLEDRQAILDCIHNYCRGIDRFDRALLLSVYHDDAIDDHGIFVGPAAQFVEWALQFHREHQHSTQHIVTNHTCDIAGDTAHAETYWMFAAMNVGPPALSLGGGRYIDRFERRGQRWAIAARKCLIDWGGTPGESPIPRELLDLFKKTGIPARNTSDPSYERPLLISPSRLR